MKYILLIMNINTKAGLRRATEREPLRSEERRASLFVTFSNNP